MKGHFLFPSSCIQFFCCRKQRFESVSFNQVALGEGSSSFWWGTVMSSKSVMWLQWDCNVSMEIGAEVIAHILSGKGLLNLCLCGPFLKEKNQ